MSEVATTKGKEYALNQLSDRRATEWPVIRNEAMPAGSPMGFPCLACGAPIWVPEMWLSKPDLCPECSALKKLGWLE